jgi:hypothetical protein
MPLFLGVMLSLGSMSLATYSPFLVLLKVDIKASVACPVKDLSAISFLDHLFVGDFFRH